jgi:hypothetical protein
MNYNYLEHKQKSKYTCFEVIILGQESKIF